MDLASQMTLLDSMLLSGVQTEFPDPLSDDEKVAISAYLVLAHACIEEYAEEIFLKQFDRLSELSHLPLTPRAVARLCLAIALSLPDAMRTNMTYKTRTLKGTVTAGRKHYVSAFITKNNGLKESNIKKLAEGIGVEWISVEGSLHSQLVGLNTLGAKRGEAGHLSPFSPKTLTLKQEAYPEDARGWVEGGRDAVLALEAFLAEDVESALRSLTELRMPTGI